MPSSWRKFSDEPLGDVPRGIDMLYSSGTTGRPKGTMPPLSCKQVGEAGADAYTAVFGQIIGLDAETSYNSCAPTYHAAPLGFGGIVDALGGTLVISHRRDAERRWRSTGSRKPVGVDDVHTHAQAALVPMSSLLRGAMRWIACLGRSCGSSTVGDDRRLRDILGCEGEGDVVDHVLLATDQAASAAFEEQVAYVDLVAFRGDLRMAEEG